LRAAATNRAAERVKNIVVLVCLFFISPSNLTIGRTFGDALNTAVCLLVCIVSPT
jgi:hypothetical protein